MGLPDHHDPRLFTHIAKFHADGTIAAIVEVADDAVDGYRLASPKIPFVDVSAIAKRIDVTSLTADDPIFKGAALKAITDADAAKDEPPPPPLVVTP